MSDNELPVLAGWARGELPVQQCSACGALQFPPRAVCLACRGDALTWSVVAPQGTIATFTVVHRAPSAQFKARVPYAIALIDFAPGVRMMMNVDGDLDAVAIGYPVTIGFAQDADDGTLRPHATLTAAAPED